MRNESQQVFRAPCDDVKRTDPTANYQGLERRVCPNCRLFFDVGVDSDTVFCSGACKRRHNRGEYV